MSRRPGKEGAHLTSKALESHTSNKDEIDLSEKLILVGRCDDGQVRSQMEETRLDLSSPIAIGLHQKPSM